VSEILQLLIPLLASEAGVAECVPQPDETNVHEFAFGKTLLRYKSTMSLASAELISGILSLFFFLDI